MTTTPLLNAHNLSLNISLSLFQLYVSVHTPEGWEGQPDSTSTSNMNRPGVELKGPEFLKFIPRYSPKVPGNLRSDFLGRCLPKSYRYLLRAIPKSQEKGVIIFVTFWI